MPTSTRAAASTTFQAVSSRSGEPRRNSKRMCIKDAWADFVTQPTVLLPDRRAGSDAPASVGLRFRVEMFKRAGFDPGTGDEGVHFLFLQADHSTELIRGQLTFINELIQGAQRHSETACRIVGRQPAEV
jgi:hypothetical protein